MKAALNIKTLLIVLIALLLVLALIFGDNYVYADGNGGDPPGNGTDIAGPDDPPTEVAEPGKPKLTLTKKTARALYFSWTCEGGAEKYEVYCSADGGKSFTLLKTTADEKYTYGRDAGTVPGKSYIFKVIAVNGTGDGAKSAASDVRTWKLKRIETSITAVRYKRTKKARRTYYDTVTVKGPAGRLLKLQLRKKGKWKTVKKIRMENSYDRARAKVIFPKLWWKKETTKWRIVVPRSASATYCRTKTIVIKTKKYYQNPSKYVQIKNKISKHGYKYYTSPVLTNNASTRRDHVNAMIRRAYEYNCDRFVVGRSSRPGRGVDCSGIVMQACYAAGVDLWPSNPYRHRFPAYEYESRNIAKMKTLRTVRLKKRRRGDLIFYSKGGIVIHVAIYLGKNKIIHAWPDHVRVSGMYGWGTITKVKRVFN